MPNIIIDLMRQQRELIQRRLTGDRKSWGGYQHLLFRLQQGIRLKLDGLYSLGMSEEDAARVVMYSSEKYGPGGFQERLRPIEGKVAKALIEFKNRKQSMAMDFGDEGEDDPW